MKHFLTLLLIIIYSTCLAQTSKIDSLNRVLRELKAKKANDTLIIQTLDKISLQYYFKADYKISKEIANTILDLSNKINWDKGKILAYQNLSNNDYKLGNTQEVIRVNYEILSLAEKNNYELYKLNAWRIIADTNNWFDRRDSSIVIYKKIIPLFLKLKRDFEAGICYLNMATTIKDSDSKEDPIVYYKKAESIFIKEKRNFWLNNTYYSMSDYFVNKNQFDDALLYLKKAISYFETLENKSELAGPYGEMAFILAKQKEYSKAILFAEKSLNISIQSNVLENTFWAHEALYLAKKGLGRYDEALLHHENMMKINTQILKSDTKTQIDNFKDKYEAEKQVQQKTIENQQLINKGQQTNLYFLSGLLLMFLALLTILFLNNRRLRKKNAEIEEAHFKGQTTERKRMATELHDNLGSQLSALRWSIMAMDKNILNPDEREIYDNIMTMIDDSYNQVRNLSHNLMPEQLETDGLVVTLEKLLKKLNRNNQIYFELKNEGFDKKLDKKIEFELYSILLELINNIIKHSKATKASLILKQSDKQLCFSVIDNGKGFSESDYREGKGLQNIQQRVNQINGKFIKKVSHSGTDLEITL